MRMKEQFYEKQRMNQSWLWLVLIVLVGFGSYTYIMQIIYDQPVGNKPMSDNGLYIFELFVLLLVLLFVFMKLETKIDENGIWMKYFPFVKKEVSWDEIETAKLVTYNFVGYGIRWGSKYGMVYNTKGDKGIAISLKNGRKFLIGTQEPQAINEALQKFSTISS
jgi:hypothetical protein